MQGTGERYIPGESEIVELDLLDELIISVILSTVISLIIC